MMRKPIWFYLLMLIVVGNAAPAYSAAKNDFPLGVAPSLSGELGLMHLGSAVVAPQYTLSVMGATSYWQMDDFFSNGLAQSRVFNRVGFAFSMNDMWEVFLLGSASSHLLDDSVLDQSTLVQSIGDFRFGTKVGGRVGGSQVVWLGGDLAAQFRTGVGELGPDLNAIGLQARFLFTADWTTKKRPTPFRVNLNVGFLYDTGYRLLVDSDTDTADPVNKYALGLPYDDSAVLFGASIEIPQRYVNFFLEYSTEQYLDINANQPDGVDARGFMQNPQRFTPGIRVYPVRGLNLDLSVDIGHSLFFSSARYDINNDGEEYKIEPDWVARVGIGYVFAGPSLAAPQEGRIWGKVYDQKNRLPLDDVIVSFPTQTKTRLLTGAEGKYRSYQFSEGRVRIRFEKDEYQAVETTVTITAGQEVNLDVLLRKLDVAGEFVGQLTNTKGEGIVGTVTFRDKSIANIRTKPGGQFQARIAPGIYTVEASAEGHDPAVKRVQIVDKKRTVANFVLQEKQLVGTLQGSVKDTKGKAIPSAVIQFVGANVRPGSTNAEGKFDMKIAPGSYTVKAFSPGYNPVERNVKIEVNAKTMVDFVLEESTKLGKVAGKVVDAKTKKGLNAVIVFPNGEQANVSTDPDTGKFVLSLDAGSYQIKAASQNYKSKTVSVKVEKDATTSVVFELAKFQKIRVTKEKVEINEKIQFRTGKSTIRTESYPILDEIAQVLKDATTMTILIEGHTDSVGRDISNKILSQKRAEAVRDYLISRGIKGDRLSSAGYGEERPIASNDVADGRAQNRRVEFKILNQ